MLRLQQELLVLLAPLPLPLPLPRLKGARRVALGGCKAPLGVLLLLLLLLLPLRARRR